MGGEKGASLLGLFAGIVVTGGLPFVIAAVFQDRLRQIQLKAILGEVGAAFKNVDRSLLRAIAEEEERLADAYSKAGIKREISSIETDGQALLDRVSCKEEGKIPQELIQYLQYLRTSLTAFTRRIIDKRNVRRVLQERDQSQSPSSHLDAMLSSERLISYFCSRNWTKIHEIVAAVGSLEAPRRDEPPAKPKRETSGEASSTEMPKTLDEAYRILNANGHTRAEVIKKMVDALRMSRHPDLARDAVDRNGKLMQINVAWDIIKDAHEK